MTDPTEHPSRKRDASALEEGAEAQLPAPLYHHPPPHPQQQPQQHHEHQQPPPPQEHPNYGGDGDASAGVGGGGGGGPSFDAASAAAAVGGEGEGPHHAAAPQDESLLLVHASRAGGGDDHNHVEGGGHVPVAAQNFAPSQGQPHHHDLSHVGGGGDRGSNQAAIGYDPTDEANHHPAVADDAGGDGIAAAAGAAHPAPAIAGTATPPPEILAAAAAAAAEVEAASAADGAATGEQQQPQQQHPAGADQPPDDADGDGDGADKNNKSSKKQRTTTKDAELDGAKVGAGGGRGSSSLPSRQACISEPFKRSFNDMLYELLKFRVNKGHLRVPPTHGNLGVWVYRLRVQHQALQRDPSRRDVVDLTRERMDVLNSLDFCWDLHKYETEKNWNERYVELLQWKEAHGHCNVPQSDPNLGKWVKMQRDYYNNTAEGRTQRKGSLTQDKIEKLEAIGFEWRLLKMVGWDKRFEELCEWKRLHGHCNVPTQTSGSLGRWVSKQRIQMTYRKNGEYSQLSDDRIEKLNSIGFVWNTKLKNDLTDDMDPPPQYLYDDSMAI